MERRSFLKVMVMMAAATVMPGVAVASTVNQNQKYIDGLALFNAMVACRNEDKTWDHERLQVKANEFFDWMAATFEHPGRDPEVTKKVQEYLYRYLNGSTKCTSHNNCYNDINQVPPEIADIVWPVAATKSLLAEFRVPVSPNKYPGFMEFVNRYKPHIVSGDYYEGRLIKRSLPISTEAI